VIQQRRLKELTIEELMLLGEIEAYRSLNHWATIRGITAMKATRILSSLESKLGIQILIRSRQGVIMTAEAKQLIELAKEVIRQIQKLEDHISKDHIKSYPEFLVIGARGYLNVSFSAVFVGILGSEKRGLQFLDFSPRETIEVARNEVINLALTLEPIDFGKNWVQEKLGELVWGLFGRSDHPLFQSEKAKLEDFRICHHAFWDGRNLQSNYGFTIQGTGLRQMGHGTESAFTALNSTLGTDHLALVPRIVANSFLKQGLVREYQKATFPEQTQTLYLSSNSTVLTQKEWTQIKAALVSELNLLQSQNRKEKSHLRNQEIPQVALDA
jgi:DNA-binding transcriptional LysR family regulator